MGFAIDERTVRQRVCPECGREYQHVTGFIVKDGAAHSVYYAACHGHPEHEAWIDVVLGSWGEGETADHVTFSSRVRREGAASVDAMVAVKGESDFFGHKLTRDEALAHPWVDEMWAVVDAVLELDETVGSHVYEGA